MINYLEAVCREGQDVNPLFCLLGARVRFASGGRCELELPVSRILTQGHGLVAGGILATIADESMAHAVISLLDGDAKTVTAEMNIRYLRATDAESPGVLTSSAKVVKAGRRVTVAEAEVHDDKGRLLATAGGTFITLEKAAS